MTTSLLSMAQQRLDQALKYVPLPNEAVERLKRPKVSVSVAIPVRMDSGDVTVFPGYRVRYDDSRGPTKGGNGRVLSHGGSPARPSPSARGRQ